jgi:hypothetical protein
MRISTIRRTLALAAFAALSGCDGKPQGTGPAAGTSGTEGGAAYGPVKLTPRQAAEAFLASLSKGEVTPDHLTPAFRKVIGKTDADVREWLDRAKGLTFRHGEDASFWNSIAVRGRAESPNKKPGPTGFSIRLVRDGNVYKADWLQFSEQTKFGVRMPPDENLAAAMDVVRNFLDPCLGNDYRLAHALLTPSLRKSVSPLPPGATPKDGIDYDPGFLIQAMRAWMRDVRGYSIAKADLGEARDPATIVVDLEVDGQKRPATIKVTRDPATGWWLISEFTK